MESHRTGRFTSSGIHVLIKSGRGKKDIFSAPGLRYIKEKKLEKLLGRAFDMNVYSKPIAWGNLMEKIVWMHHYPEWDLVSDDYNFHPEYPELWSGIPDLKARDTIGEIKSYQLKNFAQYATVLRTKDINIFRTEFPQEYWQIVSNCIISGASVGEAIAFMPFRDELEMVIDAILNTDILDKFHMEPWQYRFITEEPIDDLPFIERGGHFNSVESFMFQVPEEDKELLTERVLLAKEVLDA